VAYEPTRIPHLRGSSGGETDNVATEARPSLGSLFVGLVRPKIRERRLDSQEDNRNHEGPHILSNEAGEIRPNDHPQKDATPLQRGDVNRRPHLGSEKCHAFHLCIDHPLGELSSSAARSRCQTSDDPPCSAVTMAA